MQYSKAQQLKSKRIKPKQADLTRITNKARQEVYRRSEGLCERCGRHSNWGMQVAHLHSAGQLGSGSQPWNLVLLCGPSTDSDTCHYFADSTKKGREWRQTKRKELIKYYGEDSQWEAK